MNLQKLFLCLLALLGSITAHAYDACIGGIYYDFYGTEATVTYYSIDSGGNRYAYSGNVTIPESITYIGTTYNVTSIDQYAFSTCSGLTSVNIPESVTCIGNYAFKGCNKLTAITVPNSATIGKYAFQECSNLTEVTIPSSVTNIGEFAFDGTAWYNNQPDGLIYIGFVAYIYKGIMPDDTEIILKEDTKVIAPCAFYGCSSLIAITIPEGVTCIGNEAFSGCHGLTSVIIPSSATIGISAFQYCSHLSTVIISEGVTSIGDNAFCGCCGLKYIHIPYSVTYFGDNAFCYCNGLTSITISEGVTSIGNNAFYGCSGLTSVTIPSSTTNFGDGAFSQCSDLRSVIISEGVTTIGTSAFLGCSRLTSVTIPNSVTNIDPNAFYWCSSLANITIPNSVTSIGKDAFGVTAWYDNQPDGLVYAGLVAYKYKGPGPTNETEIVLKEGTKGIAGSAFYQRGSLNSVTIPGSVTCIGSSAFEDCSGLTSITIPEGVTSIGDKTFYGCSHLAQIVVQSLIPPSLGTQAFDEIASDSVIYVPIYSIDAYKAASGWSTYASIIRPYNHDIDISELDNVIYLNKVVGFVDQQLMLSFRMRNLADIRGFQFDLYLPEGVTVVKNSKGRIQGALNSDRLPEDDEHTLAITEQEDGAIHFLCNSLYEECFTGNDGEIAVLQVNISADMSDGIYPIVLRNIILTESDNSTNYETDKLETTLIIGDGDMPGEATIVVGDDLQMTYCSTHDLDFSAVEGLKAYIIPYYDKRAEALTAVRVDNVPAGTGLLLRADEAGIYKVPYTESQTYCVNLLFGTMEAVTLNESDGTMANFTYRNKFFYRVEGSQQVDAGSAYLQVPATAAANVKFLSINFDAEQIVGIEKIGSEELRVKSEEWAGAVYDLSGRIVNGKSVNRQMPKGLYIRDGKKVVVK